MQQLRSECAWDRKQTPETLTPYAIEEAYEVEQAVRSGNIDDVKDELGDLLLQVIFQSQMYSEQNAFDFHDVVEHLTQKLIRRHPHVFDQANTPQDDANLQQLWQSIKQQEKQQRLARLNEQQRQIAQSYLSQVKAGPAVVQAESLQKLAANIGFDFPDFSSTYAKLQEELQELNEAIALQNQHDMMQEFGDCLFALINVGRKLNIASEMALLATNHKFRQRFAYIETQAQQQGRKIEDLTLEEMDKLWEYAKQFSVENG